MKNKKLVSFYLLILMAGLPLHGAASLSKPIIDGGIKWIARAGVAIGVLSAAAALDNRKSQGNNLNRFGVNHFATLGSVVATQKPRTPEVQRPAEVRVEAVRLQEATQRPRDPLEDAVAKAEKEYEKTCARFIEKYRKIISEKLDPHNELCAPHIQDLKEQNITVELTHMYVFPHITNFNPLILHPKIHATLWLVNKNQSIGHISFSFGIDATTGKTTGHGSYGSFSILSEELRHHGYGRMLANISGSIFRTLGVYEVPQVLASPTRKETQLDKLEAFYKSMGGRTLEKRETSADMHIDLLGSSKSTQEKLQSRL